MDEDMTAALDRVAQAADGDSNDEEIDALRDALHLALSRLPAYVLVVRHPDYENDVTVDGDVQVVSIDLGSGFVGTPDDSSEAVEWATDRVEDLDGVPVASPVFKAAIGWLVTTVQDYPDAVEVVEAYERGRGEARQ